MDIMNFLLTRVSLFRGFPEDKLKTLVEESTVTTFEPNEAVIEFGEQGNFLGVLLQGEADVSVTDDGGTRHIIDLLKEGDVFGEMSIMTGDKTIADVIGKTRCTALLIPQPVFATTLIAHPPAITVLSKTISERLKHFAFDEKGQEIAKSAFKRSEDPYGFMLKSIKPMKILVINCGSSSLKYNLFDTEDEGKTAEGGVERIGEEGTLHVYHGPGGEVRKELPRGSHSEALKAMVEELCDEKTGVIGSPEEIGAVGHRVVHGGDKFIGAMVITDELLGKVEELSVLAPLHNPINLLGIREAKKVFPGIPHIAVFDTSFHHTIPPYAFLYGIPYEYYETKKIRRYGFHGMSHAYVSLKAAEYLKRQYNELEIVTCHLGNGASVCAVDHGRSVDTSMGFTPTEGLIMGTRCGNIDPAILVQLARDEGMGSKELDRLINKQSGILGISGISNDMREIQKAAEEGNNRAILAIKTFAYHLKKYIGAYMAAMGGLDVLVFTGGIGENSAGVRSLACQGLDCMGINIDEKLNRQAVRPEGVCEISTPSSSVKVLVIATNEARMIARESLKVLKQDHVERIIGMQEKIPIPIEVSAHHLHLSREHVEALFGKGYILTSIAGLSQPGQFACRETVDLIGPRGKVERVRVLGPERKETQIEIAMTEQYKLGLQPPIRESGDLSGSPGVTIAGPRSTVTIEKGVICAMRHIHMSTEEALRLGLRDRDIVRVRVDGERELVFGDVMVRVHPNYRLAMHIDTDEANAADIKTGMKGYIEGIQSRE
ncbi:MAG: acetate/propionate family kinase [Spirochaetales bacterium]|nr:acetate/propionate family kinase [Spirochaetales bacterium]